MGQDNKTVKRYRRKVVKQAHQIRGMELKLAILEAQNEILTRQMDGHKIDEELVDTKRKYDIKTDDATSSLGTSDVTEDNTQPLDNV